MRWAAATDDTACSVAEQMVDSLLGRGWKPGQIAVLTTFRRHPSHEALVAGGNTQRYWRSYLDGDNVFYTTALSFKGLERPAVVLAVNGFSGSGTEQEMMHVAMSRARSLLVVCGDLDTIRSVQGGADLAEMLGTHPWSS